MKFAYTILYVENVQRRLNSTKKHLAFIGNSSHQKQIMEN